MLNIYRLLILLVMNFSCVSLAWAGNYQLGDIYQGGIIFWLDSTNEHGLIAAIKDHPTEEQWSENTILLDTWYDGIYQGHVNTNLMIEKLQPTNTKFSGLLAQQFRAKADGTLCDINESSVECYGDWYIPSKYELNLLFKNKALIGNFTRHPYWSSTEVDANQVWGQCFGNGEEFTDNKLNQFRLRFIRIF